MASETSEAAASGPSLRIEALHIEKLRAIRRLDWPGDGPGWGGSVPDMVLVGGANGSGKTTLLDLIAEAWWTLAHYAELRSQGAPSSEWSRDPDAGALIDFSVSSQQTGSEHFRFLIGNDRFVASHESFSSYGYVINNNRTELLSTRHTSNTIEEIAPLLLDANFGHASIPGVLYIPSIARNLTVPSTKLKTPGKRIRQDRFLYRWRPPEEWDESLEALLYSARWEDLNAKEEGRPEDAHHFDSFARAYEAFFGPEKRLTWHKGELFVEIVETGALHDLSGLSSGEQQIIVLVSELLDRWRPGSLILIDEPELHLHVSWQYALWDALKRWRAERGGQVIATTQSSELFGYSEPGTNVILGGRAP